MTQEEKAKAYDEAIKVAKSKIKNDKDHILYEDDIIKIFPELKESDDERIRKELIRFVKGYFPNETSEQRKAYLAWLEKQGEKFRYWKPSEEQLDALDYAYNSCSDTERGNYYEGVLGTLIEDLNKLSEKQGEQNLANSAKTCKDEQNHVDEVEPKFHEGDWVVYCNDICQIVKREEGCNKLVTVFGIEKELVNERNLSTARLWTIQDAKAGDVLASKDGDNILIFRNLDTSTSFSSYYNIQGKGELGWSNGYFIPATKEQRDQLEKAMDNVGYTFDFEKKEVKKIKPFDNLKGLTDFERTLADICIGWIGKKIGWKEYIKDNADVLLKIAIKKFNSVQDAPFEQKLADNQFTSEQANVLDKHIDKLVGQKPAWSEGDEKEFEQLSDILHANEYESFDIWLKSLKDRVQHKQEWSEEDKGFLDLLLAVFTNEHPNGIFSTGNIPVFKANCVTSNRIIEWLKSIKDRHALEPSVEHYELEEFAKIVRGNLTGISEAVQEQFEAKYLQLTGKKMYGGFKD